ncbi:MAG: DUF362 domain-containing protein [Candidatus Diapherotrites archaeon]
MPKAKIAIVKGPERKKNLLDAIKIIEPEVKKAIKEKNSKALFIKVNTTCFDCLPSITHPKALEAALKYFYPKFKEVIIGDSSDAFREKKNNPYSSLKKNFPKIKFSDLTEFKAKKYSAEMIGGSKKNAVVSLLPEEAFTVSLALPKTHDCYVFTGCTKNMFGCTIKGRGYVHGLRMMQRVFLNNVIESNKFKDKNLIKALMAAKADLHLMDAFTGMQGNGPVLGEQIRLSYAMAGLDGIAVDSIASRLFCIEEVPYLKLLERKGFGVGDAKKIELIKKGFKELDELKIKARLHYTYKYQIIDPKEKFLFPVPDLNLIKDSLSFGLPAKFIKRMMTRNEE